MSLKEKTISGLSWSFIDNFGTRLIQFFLGIILARLLSPREYGLLGMVTVFIAFSQVIVDSGFTQALLRKKENSREEYNTVFIFNIIAGFLFYLTLFLCADSIAFFFNEKELSTLIKVVSLIIITDSVSIVQRVQLSQKLDFKSQTRYSLIAAIISGSTAIILAIQGIGVWCLVIKMLLESIISGFLLWRKSDLQLKISFDKKTFKEMFSFGSNLLLSGLLDRGYKEVNKVIVGRYFNVTELGYYTRATQFSELPSSGITAIVSKVTYPVLAKIDEEQLKTVYRRLQKTIVYIIFLLMICLASIAPTLINVLLGEKWMPVSLYLQLLCFSMMLYPIHSFNLQVLSIKGLSNLFLKLEIVKKILIVPVIVVGIQYGIKAMLISMILVSVVSYFINSHYSGKLINYSTIEQIFDLLPSFSVAMVMGLVVFSIGIFSPLLVYWTLIFQITASFLLTIILSEIFKLEPYQEIKVLLINKLKNIR